MFPRPQSKILLRSGCTVRRTVLRPWPLDYLIMTQCYDVHYRMNRFIGVIFGLTVACQLLSAAEDRDTKVRNDRKDVLETGTWIYNDLAKAIDEGKRTGKPLLVTVRCIPCVACQGFDARVLRYDPQIADLMQKFVCVRIVQANALDLSLFEHDYDL